MQRLLLKIAFLPCFDYNTVVRAGASTPYIAGRRLRPLIPWGGFFHDLGGDFFHYLILNAVNEIVNEQVRLCAIFVNDYVTNVVVSVHCRCARTAMVVIQEKILLA